MRTQLCVALLAVVTLIGLSASAQDSIDIGTLKVRADSPLARGEYPRLIITRAQRPAIRSRMTQPEIETYLKQARDLIAINKADTLLLATLYQVTGDAHYADMAKRKLGSPSWDPAWTFAYDMLAETMTGGQRRQIAQQILEQVKANRWRPRLLHCLAAWGNGIDAELEKFLLSSFKSEVREKISYNDQWTQGRGGSSMGHGYHGEHFFSVEYATAMGWTHATGDDVLAQADFDDQQVAWYVYHYLPWQNSRQVIRVGVTMSPFHIEALTPRKHQGENYLMRTITQTRNGLGQWWQRAMIGNWPQPAWRKGEEHRYGLVGRLLWLDSTIPSLPPKRFPETRFFPENGRVVMRSDWTEEATIALFQCGRFGEIDGYGGRNNLDNLHFIIYRNGYLAPDTGCVHAVNEHVWKMQPPSNVHGYGKQTIAHNSITVGSQRYEVRGYNNKLLASSLRGGQLPVQKPEWYEAWGLTVPSTVNMPASFKEGEITAYSTSPLLDYACGDATHSYPPERVKQITRQFVYLKPNLFVLFDRVTASVPAQQIVWNLHAYLRPVFHGKSEPDGVKEGHFLHTEGDTFTITNRAGTSMDVTTLLPARANRIVRTIGGKGHDFEVDGVNYGPTSATYQRLDHLGGAGGLEGVGGWRMEVAPMKAEGEVHFLHVLRVSAAAKTGAGPLETSLITQSGRTGVKVLLDAKEVEVMFNSAGETGGRVVIDGRAEALATEIEDDYDRWNSDPRYSDWMNNKSMRAVIFP